MCFVDVHVPSDLHVLMFACAGGRGGSVNSDASRDVVHAFSQ